MTSIEQAATEHYPVKHKPAVSSTDLIAQSPIFEHYENIGKILWLFIAD